MVRLTESELTGYAASDWNVLDYEMWRLGPKGVALRGPELTSLEPGKYLVAIGAAQTFGRFSPHPYPALLASELGIPVLNLGFAGAGPKMFMRPFLMDLINNALAVVLQVMSARSLSNSVFECPDDGGQLRRRDKGIGAPKVLALEAWRGWMNEVHQRCSRAESRTIIASLAAETRTLWLGEMALLRARIRPATVLFWFSKREPDYAESYQHPELLFGEFPQLVNFEMIRAVRPLFEDFVSVVSSRGSPQPLFNRFNSVPHVVDPSFRMPTHNVYYPSPEMHEDAAAALAPALSRLISSVPTNEEAAGDGRLKTTEAV